MEKRESVIKKVEVYVVELWEGGELKEERYLPGKSKALCRCTVLRIGLTAL